MRLVLRPLAINNMEDVWLYIAADNPDTADAMIDIFSDRFSLLQEQPHLGHACPELGEGLGVWLSAIIAYFIRSLRGSS